MMYNVYACEGVCSAWNSCCSVTTCCQRVLMLEKGTHLVTLFTDLVFALFQLPLYSFSTISPIEQGEE